MTAAPQSSYQRSPTTVLQVSNNHFVAGGSDRYYMELSQALKAQGIDVVPFAPADERNDGSNWSDFFPEAPRADVPRVRDVFRFLYSTAARDSLRRLLQQANIDLAHLHIYYGRITASIIPVLKDAGIPIVQTVHDFKLLCPVYSCLRHGDICEACHGRHFWKAALHRCNRSSVLRSVASATESYISKSLGSHSDVDHFIAVSEFQRSRLIENGICPSSDITTIHNFVNPDQYRPASGAGTYACYFGRVEKLKGIETLIEAMGRIPHVQLRIVGDGESRRQCEALVLANRVGNVRFSGFQSGSELADLVRGSFCTILPTEAYENCPMSVLESFAYARPVVGTDIGGIPELVDDGHDGYVVPIADPDALAERIGELASDRERAVSMGRAGREKIERQFNQEVHLSKVRAIYKRVID
jgi:glycosyltransferase involved in cell wall biosynthesis